MPSAEELYGELWADQDNGLETEVEESLRPRPGDRVTVLEAAIESLPLEDGSVAHVWCRDMLNHVRLREALSECFRALRLGGRMLVYQLLGKLCPTVYVLEKPIA